MILVMDIKQMKACLLLVAFASLKDAGVSSFQTTTAPYSLLTRPSFCSTNPLRSKCAPVRRSEKRSALTMVSYDDLMERLPSKAVIDAVDSSTSTAVVASGKYIYCVVSQSLVIIQFLIIAYFLPIYSLFEQISQQQPVYQSHKHEKI